MIRADLSEGLSSSTVRHGVLSLTQCEREYRNDFVAAVESWRAQQYVNFRRELVWLLELACAEVEFYEDRHRQQLEDDAATERRCIVMSRHPPHCGVRLFQSDTALLFARASRTSEHLLHLHALHCAAVAHRRSIEAHEFLTRHVYKEMKQRFRFVVGLRATGEWILDVRRCADNVAVVARLMQCSESQRRGAVSRIRTFVEACVSESPRHHQSHQRAQLHHVDDGLLPQTDVERHTHLLASATAARHRVHDEAVSCIRRLQWEEEAARLRLTRACQVLSLKQ